jgi:hypothetical protein
VLVLACLGFDTAVLGARACALLLHDSSQGGTRLDPVVSPAAGTRAGRAPGAGTGAAGAAPAASTPAGCGARRLRSGAPRPAPGRGGGARLHRTARGTLRGQAPLGARRRRLGPAAPARTALPGGGGCRGLLDAGVVEYARGRCSRACAYLDHAEATEPGYRLARLLRELILNGGVPLWARHRNSAWGPGADATRGPHPGPASLAGAIHLHRQSVRQSKRDPVGSVHQMEPCWLRCLLREAQVPGTAQSEERVLSKDSSPRFPSEIRHGLDRVIVVLSLDGTAHRV